MSEQWWGVKFDSELWQVFRELGQAERHIAKVAEHADYEDSAGEAVPVRIVEDAGPCDTEKGMVDPVSYFKEMGYSFCPYCGRTL